MFRWLRRAKLLKKQQCVRISVHSSVLYNDKTRGVSKLSLCSQPSMKQIKHSSKYQMDRRIHEDVGGVDSGNLYQTQSRAARRNYVFFWCMDPGVGPSSRRVQLSSRLCRDPFEWIHSPLSLWQAEGNGWGARFQQKRGGETSACTR